MDAAEKPLWAGQKEGRFFTRIEVTTMLNGAMLSVPLHVVTGRHPGPTFGIATNTHGDEFLPTMAIRALIDFHSGGSGGRLQARVDYVTPRVQNCCLYGKASADYRASVLKEGTGIS